MLFPPLCSYPILTLIPHLIIESNEKNILRNTFSIFYGSKEKERDYQEFMTFPKNKSSLIKTFSFQVMPRALDSQHSETICV